MQAPSISLANVARIETIDVIEGDADLIDIEVEGQHTFWVSDNDTNWTLTHNSGAPDIDCIHEDHLVVMADGSHKRVGDIVEGDQILGGDGRAHKITATYKRPLRYLESAVWVRVRAGDGTLGQLLVVPGHKFVLDDGGVVHCCDLKVGMKLMASCPVEVISLTHGGYNSNQALYVDVTVEHDHRFHVIPFDVIEGDDYDSGFKYDTSYCADV